MTNRIEFAQITASNCDLTKTFTLNEGGSVDSTAVAHMSEGYAKVVTIPDLSHLGHFLSLLGSNQAITCGVPAAGDTKLTTRKGSTFNSDAVARTNETFRYPYGSALFAIDVDISSDSFPSVESVLRAVEACSPWLTHIHRIARPSSSSYVAGRGLRGVHIYFVVTQGTDIPELGKRMQIEQWAAGRGTIKISKCGALLVRQLADATVYQPSRLFFEAAPRLGEGVERDVPVSDAYVEHLPSAGLGPSPRFKSPEGFLNVGQLPPLREIQERRFQTTVRQSKDLRRRQAKQIAIDYQRENALASGLDASVGERWGVIASRALGDKALPPAWELHLKDLGRVSVAQILSNLDQALGVQCADPFDTWRPDLEPKHFTKAEIVMMGDTPGVWSHKLQEFFAFSADTSADLSTPLEQAAERLCDLIKYPEVIDKKPASELNVAHALKLLLDSDDYALRYNLSTYKVEKENLPDEMALKYALARVGCLRVAKSTLGTALDAVATTRPYDPWKDAALALPVWDKVPRLDTFFPQLCGTPPSDALMSTGRLLFASIIMRQLIPGITAPVIPVLWGGQYTRKSYFACELAAALGAPPPATITFSEDIRMSMAASVSIVAELGEMTGMGRREAEDIKKWITDDNDVYRAPYERAAVAHPRRFVLIGTANKHELNRDDTGNRRMMPIYVATPIDPNWAVEARQLFAEAKARFCKDRETYIALVDQTVKLVADYNAEDMRRGVGTPVSDLDDILPGILQTQVRSSGKARVPALNIRSGLDHYPIGKTFSAQRVSAWLRTRGWKPGTSSDGTRYYEAPEDFVEKCLTNSEEKVINMFKSVG